MSSKLLKRILLVLIVLIFCILVCYNASEKNLHITTPASSEVEFTIAQKDYLKLRESINVYVDPELRYLLGEDGDGYVNEYVDEILADSGLNVNYITDKSKAVDADCSLLIVSNTTRDEYENVVYTKPIMQIEGALFVRSLPDNQLDGKGLVVSDRIKENDKRRIAFNSHEIPFMQVRSNEAAVKRALAPNSDIDYIVGDKNAIDHYLGGSSNDFVPDEKLIYTYNVCFVMEEENELYGIVNECIHSKDIHYLSCFYAEKWENGNAPVFQRNSYSGLYMVILIVILAIMVAFLLYYVANRNLYAELENRMDKLVASRNEMQTTFNGVKYFLAELNLEGDIINVNRAFFSYLKYMPAKKKVWDAMNMRDDAYESFINIFAKAVRGETTEAVEVKIGRQIFLLEAYPVEGTTGKVEKVLFMASDVTNERMAEKQMIQDNKMIAVGQLASGVAHEIRNPLGIIRNYCYVLKTMDDASIKDTAIEQIEKAVESSGAIIDNLLNFSRASSKKVESIDVKEHIESMLKLNESLLKKKDISVEMEYEKSVKTSIVVESFDLIMINLISNAIDAMDRNGHLKIILTVNESYGLFRVDVEDDGEGIDPDTMSEIFNPFFTTKIDSGGTGLGLYLVYNEVGKLNGTISVDSVKNEGTVFKVVLPINA